VSLTRIVSAVVLVVVVGGTIWWLPPWATLVLAGATAAAAALELAALARLLGAQPPGLFVAASAAAACLAVGAPAALPIAWGTDATATLLMGATIGGALLVLASIPPGPAVFAAAAAMALAPVYIGLPMGTIAWMRAAGGPETITWLVAVIAISDSAQYYAGTLFGRTKLSPVVSPKKTVEGAIGGLVAAPLTGMALGALWLPSVPLWMAAALAVILATAGIAGDLFESLLKRSVGAKDSSHVIPGHGGLLDRIDAYLFAAPVFYLFLRYLA
jgi:phosphatidate cytidylyltransferase